MVKTISYQDNIFNLDMFVDDPVTPPFLADYGCDHSFDKSEDKMMIRKNSKGGIISIVLKKIWEFKMDGVPVKIGPNFGIEFYRKGNGLTFIVESLSNL